MNIGLQTWGTDGDILPFIALAKGLVSAGHQVTLAYTSIDGKSYQESGIKFIEANQTVNYNPPIGPYNLGMKPGSFGEYTALIQHYFDPYSKSMFAASESICANSDLVIGHSICHTLTTAAELYMRDRVALALAPMVVRTNTISPTGKSLGELVNRTMWSVGDEISTRTWFTEARKIRKNLGLPRIKSLQKEVFNSKLMTIVACSSSLVSRPVDWSDNVALTGFLMQENDSQELPSGIQEFIQDGDAPVFMTFGSCMQYHPRLFTELLVEAALLSGKRAIIQTDHEHREFASNSNLLRVGQVSHSSVFKQCDMVVHHGGAGTCWSALRAGKPSVVIAHGFDQFYWAEQLCRSQVGGQPLSIDSASAETIADEISTVLLSQAIADRSNAIGSDLSKENGVEMAINALSPFIS